MGSGEGENAKPLVRSESRASLLTAEQIGRPVAMIAMMRRRCAMMYSSVGTIPHTVYSVQCTIQ